jgi:hypothetical protein
MSYTGYTIKQSDCMEAPGAHCQFLLPWAEALRWKSIPLLSLIDFKCRRGTGLIDLLPYSAMQDFNKNA